MGWFGAGGSGSGRAGLAAPGRSGRTWSNRAYLVGSSHRVCPKAPGIAGVLGRNGRGVRGRGVESGVLGRSGCTWSNRAYLVGSSHRVCPEAPGIAGVLGRNGRGVRGRGRGRGVESGVPGRKFRHGMPGSTRYRRRSGKERARGARARGRVGRTWSNRVYLVGSSHRVCPETQGIAGVLGRNGRGVDSGVPGCSGRTWSSRACLVVPGVPGGIGRTWSEVPTRYARKRQVSRAFWEGTGVLPLSRRTQRPNSETELSPRRRAA